MGTDREKVTDLDIQALVDNELDEESLRQVAQRVRERPLFQKRYGELTRQNNLLKLWWTSGRGTT